MALLAKTMLWGFLRSVGQRGQTLVRLASSQEIPESLKTHHQKSSVKKTTDKSARVQETGLGRTTEANERRNFFDVGSARPTLAAEQKTIWENYKRNFKGSLPPKRTRVRCRRGPEKIVNNPCPICYRGIDIKFTDTKLLEQFISPYTGEVLEASKTGLCRQQQKKMVDAIEKAWDHGVLPYPTPRKLSEEGFRVPPWNKIDVV